MSRIKSGTAYRKGKLSVTELHPQRNILSFMVAVGGGGLSPQCKAGSCLQSCRKMFRLLRFGSSSGDGIIVSDGGGGGGRW